MQLPDMNLLPALNALLREGSVTGAAAEMSVSASAMSRTLGRLRRVLGDPLLVPAGRGLALTPRALELRPQVEAALIGALAALQPAQPLDIASVARQFTVRTNDGLAVVIGPELTGRIAREAPGIRLRILPECEEDPADLRDRVDLDIGHLPELPHDVRSLELPPHGYAAVCRADSPHAQGPLTVEGFAAAAHITVSRRGRFHSVVDERLAELGLRRNVLATVPTQMTACFLALHSDALALVPAPVGARAAEVMPLAVLEIPLSLPQVPMGMAWHARLDADPAHAWLRRAAARAAAGG
ncbi:DNA-binding transcriptional LysR family regulator [Streptomyces olivoverticillatus]|uniref:DNA-binding transcriptional LysR family regulator n=1 Tax=Streptomyces olivoverticillatus TaxID=66427 RepID=A0A7W7PM80_9ACTN|nr:LysR family transcriptional regulator [Streptomyces olivoverticillatus]MBB4895054.1 DNA-binding transcriptional LysR family regulator [Streptomyces olivoverticillatus]